MTAALSGMKALMNVNKEIDTDQQILTKPSNIVKLRFTRKQYDTFRDACKIFEVVAADPEFLEFVKRALGADIKSASITKQFVVPIVDAPMKIPVKLKVAKEKTTTRESYFTKTTEATKEAKRLHSAVKGQLKEGDLRQNITKNETCLTDVRVMMSKYLNANNLKTEHGVIVNKFITEIAPKSIQEHKDKLQRVEKNTVIPKGDRKVMTSIVNEIAFSS